MTTELTLRKSDSGRTIPMTVGTRFRIELDENRTTGYAWSRPEFEENGLALESDDSVPAAGPGVGGGGLRRFVFLAKAPGNGTVRLMYKRPWETDVPASSRFEVTIVRIPVT